MAEFGHALDLYFGGDMEASIALSGQVAGRIDEVKPVAQIIAETVAEFEAVAERGRRFGSAVGLSAAFLILPIADGEVAQRAGGAARKRGRRISHAGSVRRSARQAASGPSRLRRTSPFAMGEMYEGSVRP